MQLDSRTKGCLGPKVRGAIFVIDALVRKELIKIDFRSRRNFSRQRSPAPCARSSLATGIAPVIHLRPIGQFERNLLLYPDYRELICYCYESLVRSYNWWPSKMYYDYPLSFRLAFK